MGVAGSERNIFDPDVTPDQLKAFHLAFFYDAEDTVILLIEGPDREERLGFTIIYVSITTDALPLNRGPSY